jgi:hypothetical protein
MQIIHLGFWKAANTSLRQRVFRESNMRFLGAGSVTSNKFGNDQVLRLIRGETVPELECWRSQPCILSHAGGLVRFGGLAGLDAVGQAISKGFSDPVLVLTVRGQERLLTSAYFQSLNVRQWALGLRNGRERPQSSRFMSFSTWWRAMVAREDCSLAGLLRYRSLIKRLERSLPRRRIVLLPLDWITQDPARYKQELLRLGLPVSSVDTFLTSQPLNPGSSKKLRKERSSLRVLAQIMAKTGALRAVERRRELRRLIRKKLYSGAVQSTPRGLDTVRDDIRLYYTDEHYDQLRLISRDPRSSESSMWQPQPHSGVNDGPICDTGR